MAEAPGRWSVEQVVALAPARVRAARPLAVPACWDAVGCDSEALWGRCVGSAREPYEVAVDHVRVASRCTCPSRTRPCKHAVALLLLWAEGRVAPQPRPSDVGHWLERSGVGPQRGAPQPPSAPGQAGPGSRSEPGPPSGAPRAPERIRSVRSGLRELDRWIADRLRTGLAAPALARYETWDDLASRLVDAKAGGLANRVRRVGGLVGARPGWHEQVLAELGVLHLLAQAGQRLPELPDDLADGVAAAVGWTVRRADVLATVPETDTWLVVGRSDTVEDRITVRRTWLVGEHHGWALVLSFAAHGQGLDDSLPVGTSLEADLHRFPGTVRLRSLIGRVHRPVEPAPGRLASAGSLEAVCDEVGRALATEPWLERVPFATCARVSRYDRRWWLVDHTGGLPLAEPVPTLEALLACTAMAPARVVAEWTPLGARPLAVHLDDRTVELAGVEAGR